MESGGIFLSIVPKDDAVVPKSNGKTLDGLQVARSNSKSPTENDNCLDVEMTGESVSYTPKDLAWRKIKEELDEAIEFERLLTVGQIKLSEMYKVTHYIKSKLHLSNFETVTVTMTTPLICQTTLF